MAATLVGLASQAFCSYSEPGRTTFVLGKGLRGGKSPAVEFLSEGGTFHDFVNLISNTADLQLTIRKNSLFAAATGSETSGPDSRAHII